MSEFTNWQCGDGLLVEEEVEVAIDKLVEPDAELQLHYWDDRVFIEFIGACRYDRYFEWDGSTLARSTSGPTPAKLDEERKLAPLRRALARVGVQARKAGTNAFKLVRLPGLHFLSVDLGDGRMRETFTLAEVLSVDPKIFKRLQRAEVVR